MSTATATALAALAAHNFTAAEAAASEAFGFPVAWMPDAEGPTGYARGLWRLGPQEDGCCGHLTPAEFQTLLENLPR